MAGYTILRLFGNLFRSSENSKKLKGKVWLYVVSQNNYDSLKFLEDSLPYSIFVAGQGKKLGKYKNDAQRVSLRRKVFYYYKYIPLLIQFLKYKPESTKRFFDILYDAVGFYEVYRYKLRKYKPSAIVFANDHNADARAMLLAAKSLGIKTIYIQHASVSSFFPPLQFDLSLLEGQDSLDKYKLCGPVAGRVELVGMPKADKYLTNRNSRQHIHTVGIGCNLLDNPQKIKSLLQVLSNAFPDIHFILRPHPRDSRDLAALAGGAKNIILSDSSKEPVFEYLQQLDVQISGNSGIHLEAVLLNVWSIYYDFNPAQQLNDYYGFVQNGLVDVANSSEELIKLINSNLHSKPDVVTRAQYHNATVGTKQEGNSAEISTQYIKHFLES